MKRMIFVESSPFVGERKDFKTPVYLIILDASHQTRTEFKFSIEASEPCANLKAPITLLDRDPAWERTSRVA